MKKKINLPTEERLIELLFNIALMLLAIMAIFDIVITVYDVTTDQHCLTLSTMNLSVQLIVALATTASYVAWFIYQFCKKLREELAKVDLWADAKKSIEAIVTDHGNTLDEVMNGIRNEKYEYSAIFSVDGDKLEETTSLSTEAVASRLGVSAQYGTIAVHNHPDKIHSSFSAPDLYILLSRGLYQSRVVSGHHLYIMTNTKFDSEQLLEEEMWEFLTSTWNQAAYELANIIAKPLARLYAIRYSQKIAHHYGLKFQRGYFIRGKAYILPERKLIQPAQAGALMACANITRIMNSQK